MNLSRSCAGCLGLLAFLVLLEVVNPRPGFGTPSTVVGPAPAAGADDAYFVFDTPPRKDLFVIKLTDPVKIQKARDILSGKEKNLGVIGVIVKEPACYNTPWSYHLDPQSIEFFEAAIEVCDGAMGYIEGHLDEDGADVEQSKDRDSPNSGAGELDGRGYESWLSLFRQTESKRANMGKATQIPDERAEGKHQVGDWCSREPGGSKRQNQQQNGYDHSCREADEVASEISIGCSFSMRMMRRSVSHSREYYSQRSSHTLPARTRETAAQREL